MRLLGRDKKTTVCAGLSKMGGKETCMWFYRITSFCYRNKNASPYLTTMKHVIKSITMIYMYHKVEIYSCKDQRKNFELTCETMASPRRNMTAHATILKIMLFFLGLSHWGNSSVNALRTHSIIENCEPNPRVAIIIKKNTDHSGATGILVKASGYTINASPGPMCRKE